MRYFGENEVEGTERNREEFKNKPKMAYSRDLPKMAVWHYGLKLL